jgi:phosphoglycerol transferase
VRIAFLNPWSAAAENQAFVSLRVAAARIGHEMVQCANSSDIEDSRADFVLASASTQPKLNDVPHYGVIHEPRDRFLNNPTYFRNLLTYDGYLTISDTLERFLRNVTYGTGHPRPVGFYYNTCQRQDVAADLPSFLNAETGDRRLTGVAREALKIAYFGTNWDKRRQGFFRLLSECEGVQIFGPEHSWAHICRNGYGGSIPFDGVGVQAKYAACGIGLCMLSDQHYRDNIVSNRIFEITSVGAIALCCDIPWIRRYFGDSVYYFDQNLGDRALKREILKLRDVIYRNPAAAIEKAQRARQIFEDSFAAEVMVGNAVKYHETIQSGRQHLLVERERAYSPFVSVVMRCGSRSPAFVERAVESISRQTLGHFEVVLVRHKDIDLSPVVSRTFSRIRSFKVVDCPGGNRSASLWAGLQNLGGEYFAVLDDDDWWFSDHLERLFDPPPEKRLERFFAYSGSIADHGSPSLIEGGAYERRAMHCFGIESLASWSAASSAFASCCFVASTDLLHSGLLMSPDMETAEDSYLILSLLAQAEPKFAYCVTNVFDRSAPQQSCFDEHPKRYEDELTLQLRLFGRHRPPFLRKDAWESLSEFWANSPSPVCQDGDALSLENWEQVGAGYEPKRSKVVHGSHLLDPSVGAAVIRPPVKPWAYGAELFLNRPSRDALEYILIAEIKVLNGLIGVGLLNVGEQDFLFRKSLGASAETQTVRIPISNISQTGRFVVQTWETACQSEVQLLSLRLFAEPA